MTEFDSRVARWRIRHPWWATGLWPASVATTVVLDGMVENKQAEFSEFARAEELQEAVGLERPPVEGVLVTPGGPEGRAAIQDALARRVPLSEVAEVGGPVPSPAGVLGPVTVMASTQRRN
ncbi:hypothetical protein [Micromonospora sp. NPDC049645]|uniref:hypothetical protein n=1 Tax=Micromonospora sp. NPDC049645 TaxID=3155508 RepID=UPI00341FDF61